MKKTLLLFTLLAASISFANTETKGIEPNFDLQFDTQTLVDESLLQTNNIGVESIETEKKGDCIFTLVVSDPRGNKVSITKKGVSTRADCIDGASRYAATIESYGLTVESMETVWAVN